MRVRSKKRNRGCLARVLRATFALALLAALFLYMNACVVRLTYADVFLRDLPDAFDGKTVLFVTDVHVDLFNAPARVGQLFDTFQSLYPDLLLLGGDYASTGATTVLEALVRGENLRALQARRNEALFERLNGFYAPLGKFAVAGNHDKSADDLEASMEKGGITLLRNRGVRLPMDDGVLTLIGLDDWTTGVQNVRGLAAMVRERECVLVVSHDPRAFADALGRSGGDGRDWLDLMLAGHTHGGQIMLGDWKALPELVIGEMPYVSGRYAESGAQLIVSNGIGTSFLPLRLGAPPDAYYLTLKKG